MAVTVILFDVLGRTAFLLAQAEDSQNAIERSFGAAEEAQEREEKDTGKHTDHDAGNGTSAETTAAATLTGGNRRSSASRDRGLERDGSGCGGSSCDGYQRSGRRAHRRGVGGTRTRCGYSGRVGHAEGGALPAELAVLLRSAADVAATRLALIRVTCYTGSSGLRGDGCAAAANVGAVNFGPGDGVGLDPSAGPVTPAAGITSSCCSSALSLIVGISVARSGSLATKLARPATGILA